MVHLQISTFLLLMTRASGQLAKRRSSTARSIGARSDFDQSEVNGYDDDHDGHSTSGSVILTDDPQRIREKEEADEHMHNYIAEQLERVKSEQLSNGYEKGDELEAQT